MIDLLKKSEIFGDCTDQELQEIANICQQVTVRVGDYIFKAKSPAVYFYIVIDGVVDLRFTVIHYNASHEVTLDRKFEGKTFGWSAFVNPNVYTLSAVAVKDTELLRIKEKDFEELCSKNNHLGYLVMKKIAKIIGERFTSAQRTLIDMIQHNLETQEH